ncbi:MAG TPA: Coq4 family protein [Chloroflexia bacterium]|nr:Coq4 family protein [Chloroflexia bacterium]
MFARELADKTLLKSRTFFNRLAFLKAFISLSDDPDDTIRVFKLETAGARLAGPEGDAKVLAYMKKYPGAVEMINQRYLAPAYKVEDLKDYASGTLGHAYYRHMNDNGFSPDFFPPIEPADELSYSRLRLRQTHDIWHVVTGYGVDLPGELALQAFYLGQYPMVFPALLVSSVVLHVATRKPRELTRIFDGLTEGWQRGKAAKSLWPVRWEEMWDRSLEDIRAEYNLTPAKALSVA